MRDLNEQDETVNDPIAYPLYPQRPPRATRPILTFTEPEPELRSPGQSKTEED